MELNFVALARRWNPLYSKRLLPQEQCWMKGWQGRKRMRERRWWWGGGGKEWREKVRREGWEEPEVNVPVHLHGSQRCHQPCRPPPSPPPEPNCKILRSFKCSRIFLFIPKCALTRLSFLSWQMWSRNRKKVTDGLHLRCLRRVRRDTYRGLLVERDLVRDIGHVAKSTVRGTCSTRHVVKTAWDMQWGTKGGSGQE